MAESAECVETKKIIDPRVEIDTSPPFESVKEAVDRFGGSGPWIPHHLLRLAAVHNNKEAFDVARIEEEAMQLERDLMLKERQTLNVLKELESAKRFVEGFKLNLMPQLSSFMDSPHPSESNPTWPPSPAGLMFNDLNQAKLNLSKTSVDLAAIQASVESLNNKLRKDKLLLHRATSNSLQTTHGPNQASNYEAEQFKKMTEATRYEVMEAMAEIERTKNCIRMAEMRLFAAKKMEEAAKAVEQIALAQRNGDLPSSSDGGGITLSFEEYGALSHKAKQAEEMCSTKFIDTNNTQPHHHHHDQLQHPVLEKFEETTNQNKVSFDHDNVVIEDSFSRTHVQRSGTNFSKFKFRNSHAGNRNADVLNGNEAMNERPNPGFRSTTSIGDVLSRKVIVQDDVVMENHTERQHVSLSQMLREQSRLILHPNKNSGEGNVQKQYFMQRKKFGFIQVPIPTKQAKKKSTAPS